MQEVKHKILLNSEWTFGSLVTPCWIWQLGKLPKGYGWTMYQGEPISIHRASWTVFHGEIPEGQWILHRCDNPSCINPDHLFLGTYLDNINDMRSKGRHAHGERVGGAKLTTAQVIEIKKLLAENRWSLEEIACRFDVTLQNIHYIKIGKTWRHVNV